MIAPKISVILPVYNASAFLNDAIDSILKQTFADFELLVIDDASTDDSLDIVKAFKDDRIKIITKEKHSGITDSLNMGGGAGIGKYIARMDADDIAHPNRLKKQLKYMEANPEVLVLGCFYRVLGAEKISSYLPVSYDEAKLYALSQNPIAHPTAFIRASVFKELGFRYDKNALHVEDYDLWVKVMEAGRIENLPEVLLDYRMHDKQISVLESKLQQETCDRIRLAQLNKLIDFTGKKYSGDFAIRVVRRFEMPVNSEELVAIDAMLTDMWNANQSKKIYNPILIKELLETIWAYYLKRLSSYKRSCLKAIMSDEIGIKSFSPGFKRNYIIHTIPGAGRIFKK